MKHYNDLNESDKKQLLQFPAYISLLASTMEEGIGEREKQVAVKLTHVKTFAGDPLVADFYKDAEKVFEQTITELDHRLPHVREERTAAIKKELEKLEPVLNKLDSQYAAVLRNSMASYRHYISRAHRNVLEYFIFPLPVGWLSD